MKKPLSKLIISCVSVAIAGLMFAHLSYAANIDPDIIAGIWLLNGDADDISENKNHGEVIGGNDWTDGKFGEGYEFDGSTHIEILDSDSLRLGQEQTIVAWVNPTARAGDWSRIVGKGAEPDRNYGLWTSASGHILFQIYGSETCNAYNPAGDDDDSFVPEGEWKHIAGTYDGDEIKIFANGSEVDKFTAPCGTEPPESEDPLLLGSGVPSGLHAGYIGVLDEVGIFRAALSENEIKDIMNKGLEGFLGVEPVGKLATTWGKIRGE